jgi:hypothetical protein
MGATILVAKRAAAFKSGDGVTTYLLFENTYEANCYPHTPHWSCRAIGTYEQVLQAVHRSMGACEGQMLRSRSGDILPENLLKAWHREMKSPVRMPNRKIPVGTLSRERISPSQAQKVARVLSGLGRGDLASLVLHGEIELDLYQDRDLVLAIYGQGGALPQWSAFSINDALTVPGAALRARRPVKSVPEPLLAVHHIDQENILVRCGQGEWQNWGWSYSTVSRFICQLGYAMEVQSPGSSVVSIKKFRQQCASAPLLDDETVVSVCVAPPGEESWRIDCANRLLAALVATDASVQPGGSVCTTTLRVVRAAGALRDLCALSDRQVTWRPPASTFAATPFRSASADVCSD